MVRYVCKAYVHVIILGFALTYLELKNPGIKSVVVVFVNVAVDVHAFSKLCCPKNRRCESSRVTLPLIKRHDKSTKSN